ncbi:MAG: TIGR04283 family arsenosugar biosynthesis glycosyltransferase [Pirellulaceae bacterium]|nr:TIGR04283 family arsenosugar biosynthesis glycosyltransferase [Pirellulaceae bacterium]
MKISTIIPCLNESRIIATAIRRAWEARADEVIVVDGGSHDGTDVIASGCPCQLLHADAGRGVQQNAGAEVATGDILLFLHADNWLEDDGTEAIRQIMKSEKIQFGAFCQKIDAVGLKYRALEFGNWLRAKILAVPYGDQGLFMRRETFFAVGGFQDLRLMEDVALVRKLRRRWRPQILKGPLHVDARRWQHVGVVRQTLRNWLFLIRYFFLGVSPNLLAKDYYKERDDAVVINDLAHQEADHSV